MNGHSQAKHENDGKMLKRHLRNEGKVPRSSYLVNHVAGGFPGDFVGFGGVEIGTGAEKESRRSDEDEREKNVPDELEPRQRLLDRKSVV